MSKSRESPSNSLFRSSIIKLVVLPTILLSVVTVISLETTLWVSSEITHFYIELIAVILGSALSFYYIQRSKVLEDRFSLFVGIGFLISVSIDLFHVIVSLTLIENVSFLKYFIPQTWFAGRFFLGIMLLVAILKYSSLSQREEIEQLPTNSDSASLAKDAHLLDGRIMEHDVQSTKTKNANFILYISLLGLVAVVTALSSLFLVFPASVLDDYSVHRPYEFPPAILFALVLFFFYKKRIHQKKDVVYKGLVLYLVIDIFTQIVMASSAVPFDTAHNMAHVLKDAGYFVNIIALILSSMQYITNLKKNNALIIESLQKVREIDKIKDNFINIAAHELRTPIQPILGLSDLINSNLQGIHSRIDVDDLKEDIQIINRNAKKLQKLTNDILDVSRIDSHILNLNFSTFDLVVVIKDLIKDLTKQAEKKRYDVSIICKFDNEIINTDAANNSLTKSSIMVNGDKTRLTQVLSNLLNNAIKFTKNGKITVTVISTNDEGDVVVSISDTGQGINNEVMSHLFEKFTTRSDSGTGLGLFISKSIIEAHNGKIWANNNENGIGSTFSFNIPVNNPDRIKG
jgi:signal transduction histidine kinase